MTRHRLGRWLRHPVLHFVLIGTALFAASELWPPSEPERPPVRRNPIVISAEQIRVMQEDFVRRWGIGATPEQMSALIAQTLEEEMLYREARVLALDFQDGSVHRRLVEKMRALGDRPGRPPEELVREARALGLDEDIVIRRLLIEKMRILLAQDPSAPPLTDTDLQDYLDRHRERFLQPAELTFSHLFLDESLQGEDLKDAARASLARARTLPPADAVALSDPFLLGLRFRAYSKPRITARFGTAFAEQVFALEPGVWSDPIASPYGLHLVLVEEKCEPRLPELAAVRRQLVEAVGTERATQRLAQGLARLRERYAIRVAGRDDLSTPGAALAAQP
ncbi:peptidyl-prolyl cis-trans isomerase [Thiocapsa roseopersicina]|uniref:peptidylprolyl isomerase n=1 Tax=Thiocapsa roseopersicina TaxID=1058 RepID=A0A1H2XX27_THIRO|nr:peptidylprolyl isomerase [Thiocapsa roseopersicina]SDW96919.1 PPIC-type PPIASE domain-containing protein [Thiocapsa roseopersicina]